MARGILAAKRQAPTVTTEDFGPDSAKAAQSTSNQFRSITQAAGKFRTVSTSGSKFDVGNQVRVQASTKGTGVAGRPTALGEGSRKRVLPGSENPDGTPNR